MERVKHASSIGGDAATFYEPERKNTRQLRWLEMVELCRVQDGDREIQQVCGAWLRHVQPFGGRTRKCKPAIGRETEAVTFIVLLPHLKFS